MSSEPPYSCPSWCGVVVGVVVIVVTGSANADVSVIAVGIDVAISVCVMISGVGFVCDVEFACILVS